MLGSENSAPLRRSGNREFGLVMAIAFLCFSAVSAFRHHGWPAKHLPVISLGFFVFALTFPRALAPLNFAWTAFGAALHRVMSPLILGALYFLVLTPFGLVFRAIKKDPLRLKIDPTAQSYWIKREGQPGRGMTNQF